MDNRPIWYLGKLIFMIISQTVLAQATASTLNDPYGLWLEEEENPEWVSAG